MSYQRERDQFIATMTREGLPLWVAELLLREATGINRRAELACSSEAADRDRVPCPATKRPNAHIPALHPPTVAEAQKYPCLCDGQGERHEDITRITLQDWRAEERIRKIFTDEAFTAAGWVFQTEGDPRGYTLRAIPPSYADRNKDRDRCNRDSIGVPCRPSRIQW